MSQQEFANVRNVTVQQNAQPSEKTQPSLPTSNVHRTWKISERLMRNFLCCALAVVCIYAVQSADLPDKSTLTAAVQNMVSNQWDESIGKIQFVSNMFPETLSVFWSKTSNLTLIAPRSSCITHTWSKEEPYLTLSLTTDSVIALSEGTVVGISKDHQGYYTIVIAHEDGYQTLYHELDAYWVNVGDSVAASSAIGTNKSKQIIFELRQEGISVNPTSFLAAEELHY